MDFAFCYFEREVELNTSSGNQAEREMDRKIAAQLVYSIRKHHPAARITQLTNLSTPALSSDIDLLRLALPEDKPMLARMLLYVGYQHSALPTVFVDADMVLAKPFNLSLQAATLRTVILCERYFVRGRIVHLKVPRLELEFTEYKGQKIEDVMPFLGCFAVTFSNHFWLQCLSQMLSMQPRFQAWNGDQLAIKEVNDRALYDVRVVSEQRIAVPFKVYESDPASRIAPFVHFKGNSKYSKSAAAFFA